MPFETSAHEPRAGSQHSIYQVYDYVAGAVDWLARSLAVEGGDDGVGRTFVPESSSARGCGLGGGTSATRSGEPATRAHMSAITSGAPDHIMD